MGLTSSSNRNNMDKSQKFGPNKTDVQKNTNNANNQQEQDQDDLRKKRCADRYDSSESSDSGVATLRCIDSSTASSDTSDPGSPYSSNSNCEDNNPSCTGTLTSSAKSVSSNISSETRIESKLHNTTNTLLPEQKSESSSYQLIPLVNRSKWPWNASAPDGAPASAAAILATSSISRNKSQQDAISHITSIKHIQTTSDSTINIDNTTVVETSIPTLVPTAEIGSVYKNLKRSSQSANDISSLVGSIKRVRMQINVAVEQKSLFTSNGKKIDTATLSQQPRPVETMASPQTKITGYFKSQIKPMNSLSQTSLLTNKKDLTNMVVRSTEFPPKKRQPKNRTKVKTTEAKNINTSVVKKMPKTVAQYNKKPVTIAPRIIETKVNLHAHSRTNQPTVVLTAIRIPPQTLQTPSTITTNMPEQQLRGPQTQSPQSTVNTEQLYHSVMPNLVQIPNLHLPKSTNIMLNANTNQFRNSSQYCVLNGAVIKLQTSDGKNLSPQTTKHFSNQSVGQSLFMPNGLLVNTSMQAMLSPTFTSHHSLGQQQQQGHQTTNTSLQMPSLHRILPHHNQNHQPQHQTAHHNILPLSSLLSSNHPPSLVPISTQTPLSNGAVSAYIPPNTSLSSSPMISNIPSPIVSNLSHLTPFSTCASTVVTSTTMCSAVMVQSTQPQQQSSYLHTNTQATTSLSSSSSSATASMLPYVNNGYGTIVTSNSFNFKNNPITNQLLYSAITSTTTSALATSVTKALSSSSALQLATTSVLPSNALSQFNNAVFKKLPINLPNTNVDTTASSISSDAKSTEDMFSCADIVRNFKKLETTEKKPTNSALESNNSLISSNSISLTSTRIPQTSIKSSSPPPLQRIQKYLQDPQSVVSSFTTTHSNASSACGSSSQMASPKSLVLERIQKKTTTQIIEIEKISSHCNRTRYSTDYNSSTTKQLMLSTTCIETDPKYHSDCAKSPILQQPKTIRFPAPHGVHSSNFRKSDGKITGVCYWDECNAKYDTSSLLLDHMQTQHVNTQIGPFACAWAGCKVHSRQSCSRRWLERHVLSHGGTKPFKCIVEGCGLRFGSQLALQKHVNAHFTNTDISKELTTKRSSDPPIPKQLRKNGKKLRYRRQPFSARMFDFFDNGIMEGLQYRLHVMAGILNQQGDIVFKGQSLARRVGKSGEQELLVKWSPCNIICNEWVKTTSNCLTKSVPILKMSASERVALEEYFKLANKGHMEEESAEASEFQKIHFGADVGELKNPPQTPKRSRKQQPMRTPS